MLVNVLARIYHWGNPLLEVTTYLFDSKNKRNFLKLGQQALEGFNIHTKDEGHTFIASKVFIDTTTRKTEGISIKYAYAIKKLPKFFSDLESTT